VRLGVGAWGDSNGGRAGIKLELLLSEFGLQHKPTLSYNLIDVTAVESSVTLDAELYVCVSVGSDRKRIPRPRLPGFIDPDISAHGWGSCIVFSSRCLLI